MSIQPKRLVAWGCEIITREVDVACRRPRDLRHVGGVKSGVVFSSIKTDKTDSNCMVLSAWVGLESGRIVGGGDWGRLTALLFSIMQRGST